MSIHQRLPDLAIGRTAAPGAVAEPAVRISGISKSYGSLRVLNDISFDIGQGRVHALVGENGAGKSTLVKIITGLVRPDAGEILVKGRPAVFHTPLEARAQGVTAVYQDPKLFPHLDVAENMFVGNYPRTAWGTVDRAAMYRRAEEAFRNLGVALDPRALVGALSMAELQFVEIARALSGDVQLLILDEPTSPLTPAEAERLFDIVRRLRGQGKSVLLITHRLEEVEALADEATVLRDGRHVATRPMSQMERGVMVKLMVGRELSLLQSHGRAASWGRELLRVEGLTLPGSFRDVSFSLHAGEIVGMAGLVGAGRSEIAQALFGMTPAESGHVTLDGHAVTPSTPAQMLGLGLAYLPEDRDGQGLIMSESVADNVTLPIAGRLGHAGLRNRTAERQVATEAVATYDIRTRGIDKPVGQLSGGNRQKVALARWLATKPAVLILDEPTHGVDIGSKAQIHQMIADLAASGLAILMISSDLPEILAMSDRILVVAAGRIVSEIAREDATQEGVMRAATHSTETGHG
ncbi:ABC transporter related [Gluconacetobacter diazotrophicus PA1 5]|uniref:sugar ABC transporter ATP-binding protein n=1 Tax=Gluconacetobacter diazotrophicus TaxID=33996 RepID=UPI000173DB83|nr:sugar ABC transporter ATP-binding protein [Gluconacetobacter diazotrophicus]ACI52346.1 ABC transporter related [Gluconacetobacter diazotrophicus PA1 5]TWB05558.1 monosaccharide ABC transporter ATP-binding protein (CUT2 family) [Gluconacetobacter diazotrophicus]